MPSDCAVHKTSDKESFYIHLKQGCTRRTKMWEPTRSYGRHKGGVQQVPYWGPMNIRCCRTEFGLLILQAIWSPGMCIPNAMPVLCYTPNTISQQICLVSCSHTTSYGHLPPLSYPQCCQHYAQVVHVSSKYDIDINLKFTDFYLVINFQIL